MHRSRHGLGWVLGSLLLSCGACGPAAEPEGEEAGRQSALTDPEPAVERLRARTGGDVTVQRGLTGLTRALTMSPRFPVSGLSSAPAAAAIQFLTEHADTFQLEKSDVSSFAVTRVDGVGRGRGRHVVLQRLVDGDPVFGGQISVHLNNRNEVFSALGGDAYKLVPPTNHKSLLPVEAARAAARALGLGEVDLDPVSSEPQRTVFRSRRLLGPMSVVPMVLRLSDSDSRFVYRVTLTWRAADRRMQSRRALVDAASGEVLQSHDLVQSFTGRVFTASPGATPAGDGRGVVSFDGDQAASPLGWVGSERRTAGNNVIAATDLDGYHWSLSPEIEPMANANDSFDFPFAPDQDASNFREAAVTNAFYLVNAWHDRAYALGFTEASGNFQHDQFLSPGSFHDEVLVDVQDSASKDNATMSTPDDGESPVLQLYLFDVAQGSTLRQDPSFDPSVLYHELTHGLSIRLMPYGASDCASWFDSEAGGVSEGWSDFLAASFLGDPVIGAYVTGNATTGVRRASMASSPFTYADLQSGYLRDAHDQGEVWAATLWDIRNALGQATTEQLVVDGMKLTQCFRLSMPAARDAILQADAALDDGANQCALWKAFAGRGMGSGVTVEEWPHSGTSDHLPTECLGMRAFTSNDTPVKIAAEDRATARASVAVPPLKGVNIQNVFVDVDITHGHAGLTVVQIIAPDGKATTLPSPSSDTLTTSYTLSLRDITGALTSGSAPTGNWQLVVHNLAKASAGTINTFRLTFGTTERDVPPVTSVGSARPGSAVAK